MKLCKTCNVEKTLNDFWKDSRRKDGFFSECKICNRSRARVWYKNNYAGKRSEYVERVRKSRKLDPIGLLLRQAKYRAKGKGIEFSIGRDDVEWSAVCPVFGFPIYYGGNGTKMPGPNSASMDRVDNDKGYIPGNVVVISHRANAIKRDASLDELQAITKWLMGQEC